MPLKLNIGLNKKVGESNYGSRGASVNLEVEVDSTLVTEPGKFHEKVRQLFGLVRVSLNEELNGGNGHNQPTNANGQDSNQPPRDNGNGNKPRAATQSQVKALFAITRNQGVNLPNLLRDRFRVNRADDLTIKEASSLIDELKKSENQNGG